MVDTLTPAVIGAGIAVQEPFANILVDIGAGVTDFAVVSNGKIVRSEAIEVGGDDMDNELIQEIKRDFVVQTGEETAERLKIKVGSAIAGDVEDLEAEVTGTDLCSDLPKTVTVSGNYVRKAIEEPVNRIVEMVKINLPEARPQLTSDIKNRGIVLVGGGSLLRGLEDRLRDETGFPVRVADPMRCVAVGLGKILEGGLGNIRSAR